MSSGDVWQAKMPVCRLSTCFAASRCIVDCSGSWPITSITATICSLQSQQNFANAEPLDITVSRDICLAVTYTQKLHISPAAVHCGAYSMLPTSIFDTFVLSE